MLSARVPIDVPWDAPALDRMRFRAGRYEPFTPPEISQHVRVASAALRFDRTGFDQSTRHPSQFGGHEPLHVGYHSHHG